MKFIKTLSVALLIAASTQAFAADALADRAVTARTLYAAGIRNADTITNETLAASGFKKSLALAKVRAAFIAGCADNNLVLAAIAPVVAHRAPLALDLGTAPQHGTAADHATIMAGFGAGTHAIVNIAEHHIDAPTLVQLRAGTHVVADRAAIHAETAAKVLAERGLAALTVSNTTLRAAAAATYKLVPAPQRPQVLREAYTAITDADALVTVGDVAALTGGNITPMDDGVAGGGVPAPLPPVNAADFLAALNETVPIAGFDVGNTLAALHIAHDVANLAEINALEALALAYQDFV